VDPQAVKSVTLAIKAAITALRFSFANALAIGKMSLVMCVLPACWRVALAPATWVYWGTLRPTICNGMYGSQRRRCVAFAYMCNGMHRPKRDTKHVARPLKATHVLHHAIQHSPVQQNASASQRRKFTQN
jgi:hypothetical protein